MNRTTIERRIAGLEVDVHALARRLLPKAAPDPDDPETLFQFLTSEELWRLEAVLRRWGEGEPAGDEVTAAWEDVQHRAVARMLTGVDAKALEAQECAGRVLVRVDHPPAPGRTKLLAYVPDQTFPGLWHVEAVYSGALPRTMTTAELAERDPIPWPPGAPR